MARTLWECIKDDMYVYNDTLDELIYYKDIYKTQKEIDAMEQEDIDALNKRVKKWASKALERLSSPIVEKYSMLKYARKRYKELRAAKKDPHPMWRSRGLIELVAMETGLPIVKFTTGFEVTIGETSKHLVSLKLLFDKDGKPQIEQWYRVYKKTRVWTPEETEAFHRKYVKELAEKREKSYLRNYEKLGLKKTWLHKKFQADDGVYEVVGLEMKNKKMPVVTVFTANNPDSKDNGVTFNCTVKFITSKKQVKETKGQ